MSKTLLQLTQNILSDMDSDEVNSIYDTVEALQVAQIVINTLEAEFNEVDLPSFQSIIKLESVSDPARPNYLRYGTDVSNISTLRYRDYRNRGQYRVLEYMPPKHFFDYMLQFTGTGANTQEVVDESGISYYIRNNSAPTFYTSVDNNYLIFDSFDSESEDTLEETNTFALGSNFGLGGVEMTDEYVPPIPTNAFPLLLAEAKATAFVTLKQMPSPKSEQIARRQRSRLQKNRYKSRSSYGYSNFNFARNR